MQLNIDFDKNRKDKDEQPHHFPSSIDDLIKLEDSIQTLSRKNWEHRIDYFQNAEKTPDDFIILDHEGKNFIFFLNQLRCSNNKLSMGTQIIRHWLIGETIEKSYNIEDEEITLKKEELEIFFKGDNNQINEYRKNKGSELKKTFDIAEKNGAIGWVLYHYDSKLFSNSKELSDAIKDLFSSVYEKYKKYKIRVAYGIVSKDHHLRTNKRNIIKFVNSFLEERGFDITTPYFFNDRSRNGEPILLWVNNNFIGGKEFKAAIGINFGYDNGQSGYKFGLGLYICEEELFLSQISNRIFYRTIKDAELKKSFGYAWRPWRHHRIDGKLEKVLEKFYEEHYNKIFDNLVDFVNNSKKKKIPENNFISVINNMHRPEFMFMEEKKKKIANDNLEKYGSNKYAHFISWLHIAKEITEPTNQRKKSLAEFIAACILARAND